MFKNPLTGKLLNGYGLVGKLLSIYTEANVTSPQYVFVTDVTNTATPQPGNKRGEWTSAGVWSSTGYYYF